MSRSAVTSTNSQPSRSVKANPLDDQKDEIQIPRKPIGFESFNTLKNRQPVRRIYHDSKWEISSYHLTDDWFKIFCCLFVRTETRVCSVNVLIGRIAAELLIDRAKIPPEIRRAMIYKILYDQCRFASRAYLNLLNTFLQVEARQNFMFIPERVQYDIMYIKRWALKYGRPVIFELCNEAIRLLSSGSSPKPFYDITWVAVQPYQDELPTIQEPQELIVQNNEETNVQTSEIILAAEPKNLEPTHLSPKKTLPQVQDLWNKVISTTQSSPPHGNQEAPLTQSSQDDRTSRPAQKRATSSESGPSEAIEPSAKRIRINITRISSPELSCGKLFKVLEGEHKNKQGVYVGRDLSSSETVRGLIIDPQSESLIYVQLSCNTLIQLLPEEITHRVEKAASTRIGPIRPLSDIHVRRTSDITTVQIRGGCWNGEYATVIRSWKSQSLIWVNGNKYPQYLNNDVMVAALIDRLID